MLSLLRRLRPRAVKLAALAFCSTLAIKCLPMKRTVWILVLFVINLNGYSQAAHTISKEEAIKIAIEKGFDKDEAVLFVQKAAIGQIKYSSQSHKHVWPMLPAGNSCINLDFEQQNFLGWSGEYGTSYCHYPTPNIPTDTGTNFTVVNSLGDQHAIMTSGKDSSVTWLLPCGLPFWRKRFLPAGE